MTYLCELYPHIAHLHGSSPKERALVNQYISWYQNYFRPALFKPIRMHLGALFSQQPILESHLESLKADMFEAIGKLD
jgi:glutathione S-transferase